TAQRRRTTATANMTTPLRAMTRKSAYMSGRERSGRAWPMVVLVSLWLVGLLLWGSAGAQTASPVAEGTSADGIQHAMTSLKANGDLDAAIRDQALERYQQALSALDAAADRRDKIKQLKQQAEQAPALLARLQRQLAGVGSAEPEQDFADMTAEQLAERLDELEAKAAEINTQLADLHNELTSIARRPVEARDELAGTREALRRLEITPERAGQK